MARIRPHRTASRVRGASVSCLGRRLRGRKIRRRLDVGRLRLGRSGFQPARASTLVSTATGRRGRRAHAPVAPGVVSRRRRPLHVGGALSRGSRTSGTRTCAGLFRHGAHLGRGVLGRGFPPRERDPGRARHVRAQRGTLDALLYRTGGPVIGPGPARLAGRCGPSSASDPGTISRAGLVPRRVR